MENLTSQDTCWTGIICRGGGCLLMQLDIFFCIWILLLRLAWGACKYSFELSVDVPVVVSTEINVREEDKGRAERRRQGWRLFLRMESYKDWQLISIEHLHNPPTFLLVRVSGASPPPPLHAPARPPGLWRASSSHPFAFCISGNRLTSAHLVSKVTQPLIDSVSLLCDRKAFPSHFPLTSTRHPPQP